MSLCVSTSVCGHIFAFTCVCAFTLGILRSSMCLCVCLRLYCVSWWQTGSREEETQETPNKIGSDSLHWCWWKIWLFPSSGVGVWYFRLPLSDNTLDKTRFIKKMAKCLVREREGGRHGNWARAWLHLSSPHSLYLSPSACPLWQDVSIVQMQKQPSCLLI